MSDALAFLERGYELVPLGERRIPLIKWMHRPQSRVATVAQLERWSNAAHGWARIIPEGQCVLDVDGPIDGETQGELPTTFTIPSSRGRTPLVYGSSDAGLPRWRAYPRVEVRYPAGRKAGVHNRRG